MSKLNSNLADEDMQPTNTQDSIETHPIHQAKDLTKGSVQAQILLDGQVYTLRITKANKLILTK